MGIEEKRTFIRVPFNNTATIIGDEGSWITTLIDVSLNGALILEPANWRAKIGDTFMLEFRLTGSEQSVRMEQVKVAHMNKGHIGFSCEEIDLDSITHLKRLMELNLGDANLVYREMAELGHLH